MVTKISVCVRSGNPVMAVLVSRTRKIVILLASVSIYCNPMQSERDILNETPKSHYSLLCMSMKFISKFSMKRILSFSLTDLHFIPL